MHGLLPVATLLLQQDCARDNIRAPSQTDWVQLQPLRSTLHNRLQLYQQPVHKPIPCAAEEQVRLQLRHPAEHQIIATPGHHPAEQVRQQRDLQRAVIRAPLLMRTVVQQHKYSTSPHQVHSRQHHLQQRRPVVITTEVQQ